MQFLELRIPPIAQVLILATAMLALATAFPEMDVSIPGSLILAAGLLGTGSIIALLGVLEFLKARTTTDPRYPHQTESMVVCGVYRFSRNPMYLGFLLMLSGWACYLTNYLPFLLLPLFVVYMNRFQIQPEERHLQQNFGAEFHAYAARVRRWI